MLTNAPKGTKDVLPSLSYRWRKIEYIAKVTAGNFGVKEIRTPVFEHTVLFERGMGDTTDVVQKEMYTFKDKKGRSITLKPEGTAGAVRALVENGVLNDALPIKVFYFTPCFRYEAPQSGRLREHHQFGVEYFGSGSHIADAELICLAKRVLSNFGLLDLSLKINSVGCPSCRAEYQKALKEFFGPKIDKLCGLCRDRLERNPLRLLDCKVPECKPLRTDAPKIRDYLCTDCETHWENVLKTLDTLEVAYEVDHNLVRGLDYYTGTVFEFIPERVGGQTTICAGGRYNNLVEEIGGKSTPALGFGIGLERVLGELDAWGISVGEDITPDIYIVSLNTEQFSLRLANELRNRCLKVETDIMGRSLKAQMKYADKVDAKYVIVIGENEVSSGVAELKDMYDKSKNVKVTLESNAIYDALTVDSE